MYEKVANNYRILEISILPDNISTIKEEPLATSSTDSFDCRILPEQSIYFELVFCTEHFMIAGMFISSIHVLFFRHHGVRGSSKDVCDDSNTFDLIKKFFNLMCDLCSESFTSIDDCFIHYEIVHCKSGYLICCGMKYSNIREMTQHVVWHQNPDAYKLYIKLS